MNNVKETLQLMAQKSFEEGEKALKTVLDLINPVTKKEELMLDDEHITEYGILSLMLEPEVFRRTLTLLAKKVSEKKYTEEHMKLINDLMADYIALMELEFPNISPVMPAIIYNKLCVNLTKVQKLFGKDILSDDVKSGILLNIATGLSAVVLIKEV